MRLILASNSPRRAEILRRENIDFIIKKIDVSEDFGNRASPIVMALSFAFEKGIVVARENPKDLILSFDTLVSVEGEVLGKPKSKDEARRFLRLLSGNFQSVITAFSFISLEENIKLIDYDETILKFRELSEEEIEEYIATPEPYDKAGGYGIQGEADKFVEFIKGSFDNVVGLPIEKIKEYLERIYE